MMFPLVRKEKKVDYFVIGILTDTLRPCVSHEHTTSASDALMPSVLNRVQQSPFTWVGGQGQEGRDKHSANGKKMFLFL